MTEAEKIICKMYLENYGKYKDCNEYKLLMGLLEKEPCEDVISREKAKQFLYERIDRLDDELYDTFSVIIDDMYNDLPSITQNLKEVSCEDAISRQAVIDAMYNLCDTEETLRENPWRDNPHIDAIIDVIGDLPSVTPLKKVGKWISVENEEMETIGYYCSECDLPMETEQRTKFCPNCGTKMEVE